MKIEKPDTLQGKLLGDDDLLTLPQLCKTCRVEVTWVVSLIEEGIIEPTDPRAEHWHFNAASMRRARKVKSLQKLGVNIAGAALALELMDEIEALRTRLKLLQKD